ncbi:MAG: cytochrome d ubiquinol oxidase subunit II [Burkholderiales bacterium]|nr:cytochrome d ubiquinol oxidase subunit II [Burkholderiales bacterium]
MEATGLQITWFVLFFVLIAGYAVLDGFDLGVGVLSLFNRSDAERRLYINAIAPVWDGNEVWLLTAGGALFAAFPPVYATTFSGMYLAMMLVLLGLISRAVAMEFRGKVESATWRRVWDRAFGLGSLLPTILFGVAVGNILRGLPLDAEGEFVGTFLGLLNPLALLCGALALAMFVTHGAAYLACRTEGDLRQRSLRTAGRIWWVWAGLYVAATVYAWFDAPALFATSVGRPLFWILLVIMVACLGSFRIAVRQAQVNRALVLSGAAIAATIGLCAAALFPNLVPALAMPAHSLTLVNSSSSPLALRTMLIIALIGMPMVLAYTVFIYAIFRGPVRLDEHSY